MNNNSSKQVLLSVIGVAILVVAVVGVSFAFFSYTAAGKENVVQTGNIVFTASTSELTLEEVFPTSSASTDEGKVATVKVSGSTNYNEGIDFRVIVDSVTDNTGDLIDPTISVSVPTSGLPAGMTVENAYTAGTALVPGTTVLCTGHIPADTDVSEQNVLTVGVYFDEKEYHISDSEKQDLIDAKLLSADYAGKIIKTSVWNAMSADGKDAYSFTVRIIATQGNSGRPTA